MNQSDFISRVREKEPYFSHGLDDEALWEVLQNRFDNLKDEPYQKPISPPKNLQPDLSDDIDYDSFSPSTVNSTSSS